MIVAELRRREVLFNAFFCCGQRKEAEIVTEFQECLHAKHGLWMDAEYDVPPWGLP
eukprot:CAMPEP_0119507902 /NCGR_PEP_ID=MMETSP1344-20130328/27667_1 /TAXON_ID=236787 /ORGANISM="Florenciella parvula, Strain CCMP2471" /LENGTH=55 /DNA_ID=CAMNT_0007544575 /DNA_START=26 /DNA_END=190 /DNA_ORIENTATION=+